MTRRANRDEQPTQGRDRKYREQGYEDGRLGRRRRWPDEPVYVRSYVLGAKERAAQV